MSIGIAAGMVIGAVQAAADWHKGSIAEVKAKLASAEAQIAELKMSGTIRDDQIREVSAALEIARGAPMVSKLAILRTMLLEARQAYDAQWAEAERLSLVVDDLEGNSA